MTSQRAAVWALALFVGYLVGALGLRAVPGLPWEPALVVLPLGALLIWRSAVRRPVRDLLGRGGLRGRALVLSAAGAAAYSTVTLLAAHALDVRTTAGDRPGALAAVVIVLVAAPLVAGVVTGLFEEAVFRGFYLAVLYRAFGVGVAVTGSSLLFGLGHLPNIVDGWELEGAALLLRLVLLVGFGLLMAWATLRTGAIWFAVAWHAGGNYAAVLAELLLGSQVTDPWGASLLGVALLGGEAIIVVALVRRMAPNGPATGAFSTTSRVRRLWRGLDR